MSQPLPDETPRESAAAVTDPSKQQLARAREAVKRRVLQTLWQQAVAELGSPEQLAQAVLTDAADPALLARARQGVEDALRRDLAEHARRLLETPADLADRARQDVDGALLLDAAALLEQHLLADVAARATDRLGDARATADAARAQMAEVPAVVQDAGTALHDLLVGEVIHRTTNALSDAYTVARALADVPELAGARTAVSDALRQAVLDEAGRQTVAALADARAAADEALQALPADRPELQGLRAALRARVLDDAARAVEGELAEADDLAADVAERVPDAAVAHLRAEARQHVLDRALTDVLSDLDAGADDLLALDVDAVPAAAAPDLGPAAAADDDASATVEPEATPAEPAEPAELDAAGSHDDEFVARPDAVLDAAAEAAEEGERPRAWVKLEEHREPPATLVPADASSGDGQAASDDAAPIWPDADPAQPAAPTDAPAFLHEWSPKGRADRWMLDEFSPCLTDDGADVEADAAASNVFITLGDQDLTWDAADDAPAPAASPVPWPAQAFCYYVYGIVQQQGEPVSGALELAGFDPAESVQLVPFRSMHAAVSRVPADAYGPDVLADRMQDVGWGQDHLRTQRSILDALAAYGTVVPVAPGEVYASEAALQAALDDRFGHYLNLVHRLAGRQEWGLRIVSDLGVLRRRVEDSDRQVDASLGTISKGVMHFVRREMDRLSKQDDDFAALACDHCVKRTHDVLMCFAEDGLFQPLPQPRSGAETRVILNAAYLVADEQVETFHQALERLADGSAGLGFQFERSGPWPPFHFADEDAR